MLSSPGLPADVLSHTGGQGLGPVGSSPVQQQQQQQQQQQHLQQTAQVLNGHANGLSQGNTINGMPPPQAVNGNAIQTHNGAMLLPFLQNLSDDVRHV